jgi:hypothetical protein
MHPVRKSCDGNLVLQSPSALPASSTVVFPFLQLKSNCQENFFHIYADASKREEVKLFKNTLHPVNRRHRRTFTLSKGASLT